MISGPVVVDASVVVEYLVVLTHTDRATALFRRLTREETGFQLIAPDLIYPESVSAIRKLVRLRAIPPAAGAKAVDRLTRLPIAAAGTAELMPEAWAVREALTVYDACYVLLARRLGAALVTTDDKLIRWGSRSKDKIAHVRDV
ncbi:MAG: type II toxin-antitoxin system VapC family toxin [Candidatus Binatia bacterium]